MERKIQKKGETSKVLDDFVFVESYMGERDTVKEHRIDIPSDYPPYHQPPSSPPRRRYPPVHDIEAVITPTTITSIHHRFASFRRAGKLSSKTCLHAILALLLVCFVFSFWWFSSPGNLDVKDGRLMGVHSNENLSVYLNDTRGSLERLVILAVAATSPNPSLNSQ